MQVINLVFTSQSVANTLFTRDSAARGSIPRDVSNTLYSHRLCRLKHRSAPHSSNTFVRVYGIMLCERKWLPLRSAQHKRQQDLLERELFFFYSNCLLNCDDLSCFLIIVDFFWVVGGVQCTPSTHSRRNVNTVLCFLPNLLGVPSFKLSAVFV